MRYFLFLALLACGKTITESTPKIMPPVFTDDMVVLARASFNVSLQNDGEVARFFNRYIFSSAYAANPSNQAVTVVLAPNTTMSMSNAGFSVPPVTNDMLDFGSLVITALQTNDLKKCGVNNNSKCTKALFRVYTSGKPGSGFWNDLDAYGVPMNVIGADGEFLVGLNQANAAITQMITIPSNKNVIRLSDFSPVPNFNIKGDFYNAGAGSYATTINVEFGLAQ